MLFDIIETYDDETKDHLKKIWKNILLELAKHEDSKKIASFLAKCCVLGVDENKQQVHIGIPNDFIAQQVNKFFKKSLHTAIKNSFDTHYAPNFTVYKDLQNGDHPLQENIKKVLPEAVSTQKKTILEKPSMHKELTNYFGILFDPQYTFQRFIVGAHNELSYSAAEAIAKKPGEVYNPFFIYGNVGLGKTHLMQAIGNYILDNNPDKVVLYLPTSRFIDQIISAVRKGNLGQLQTKLEEVDVLMLDDIQFLAGKERTQEIFHNIFNEFYAAKKQIILTSDRSPKELTLLESRLQSRFALGLVTDIKQPDLETRIAILQAKLNEKDIALDSEYIELIAQTVNSNIRELEGALNIIITRITLLNKEITQNDIITALETLGYTTNSTAAGGASGDTHAKGGKSRKADNNAPSQHSNAPSLGKDVQQYERIIEHIANYFGILVSDIRGKSRKKEVSRARQLLMFIGKKHFQRSFQKIGDYFGGKNHASVIYAVGICEKLLNNDAVIKQAYADTVKKFL